MSNHGEGEADQRQKSMKNDFDDYMDEILVEYRHHLGCYNIRPPDIRPQMTQDLPYIRPTFRPAWIYSHHVSVLLAYWV